MTGEEFAERCSSICHLDEHGTDAEMVEALTAFASECGVELIRSDIEVYFNLKDGTVTEGRA